MDGRRITLRDAAPTLADGRAYARLLDQAAEGFFRFLLGRRSGPILAVAFCEPGHDLSYENVTFAERAGAVVGMVSGYTAEQHRRSTRRPLEAAAGRHHLRLRILSLLLAPLLRIVDAVPDGTFYLQGIAVDDALRGEGVGSLLLDAFEARARAHGATRLALDVAAGNGTARRFYARRGWTVASRWPRRVPLPGLTFYRLTRGL